MSTLLQIIIISGIVLAIIIGYLGYKHNWPIIKDL